jgi:hypothetical protein
MLDCLSAGAGRPRLVQRPHALASKWADQSQRFVGVGDISGVWQHVSSLMTVTARAPVIVKHGAFLENTDEDDAVESRLAALVDATTEHWLGSPFVVASLSSPGRQPGLFQTAELEKLTRASGLTLRVANVRTKSDLTQAFIDLDHLHADAVLLGSDALLANLSDQIVALAALHKVPVIYPFPVVGGLMSYGVSVNDVFHQMGLYTGRILKGEKPADLPVVQAAKVELAINPKTAKSLGLIFSLPLLGRADEVIE